MQTRKTLMVLAGVLLTAGVLYAAGKLLYIQVKFARVRSAPDYFMSKAVAVLRYGDRVEVLETKGGWSKVKLPDGKVGWISTSAIADKEVRLRADGRDARVRADNEELALAGRGFSREVEESFRRGSRLDYTWVDRMQNDPAFRVSLEEMRDFLVEGGLLPAEATAMPRGEGR